MAKKPGNWARTLGDAMSMATSFAAAVALGYFGGNWLDKHFETGFIFTIILVLLGVATGLKMMYDMAFGKGHRNRERIENSYEKEKRNYSPSHEIVDALGEAKKRIAVLNGSEDESSPGGEEDKEDQEQH